MEATGRATADGRTVEAIHTGRLPAPAYQLAGDAGTLLPDSGRRLPRADGEHRESNQRLFSGRVYRRGRRGSNEQRRFVESERRPDIAIRQDAPGSIR